MNYTPILWQQYSEEHLIRELEELWFLSVRGAGRHQRLFIPAPTLPSTASPAQQTPSTSRLTSACVRQTLSVGTPFTECLLGHQPALLFQTGVDTNQDVGWFLTGGGLLGSGWNDGQCQPEERMRWAESSPWKQESLWIVVPHLIQLWWVMWRCQVSRLSARCHEDVKLEQQAHRQWCSWSPRELWICQL